MSTERIKTLFNDNKLKLTAKPVEQGCRPPTLEFGTYLNNPQLTCFTNCDNGSGVTIIGAGYDPTTFYELLEGIRFFATHAPNDSSAALDTLTDIPKEKRTDPKQRMEVKAVTQIGRDQDGRIWISVQDAKNSNAPKIRFYFQTNYYHKWHFKNVQMSPAEQSQRKALSWCTMMEEMVGTYLLNNPNAAADAARAKEKWANKGGNSNGGKSYGNGGGNKSYGNNNNGGGNKSYGNNGGNNKSYGNASSSGDGFNDAGDFGDDDF